MPHGASNLGCSFAAPSTFDGWLRAVPCRRESGGVSWRRAATLAEGYLGAIAFVVLATIVRHAVHQFVIGSQFATYFLAVIAATLCGGICVGLASIALSMLPAWYFFLAPIYPGFDAGEAYTLLAFVFVAVPIVFIIGNLQGAGAIIQDSQLRAAIAEERARTADELRRWKHIFDDIGVGIAISDSENNTLNIANPAYTAMHRIPVDAVAGFSVFDTYAPDERQRVAAIGAKADRDGIVDFEAYHLRTDGSTFLAQVHVTSVPRTDGMRPYRIVTVMDITAAREVQTRLNDIFDNAAFGISIIDPARNVVRFANPAYAAAHAMSVNEILGKSIYEMYLPGDRERITDLHAAADRDGAISYEVNRVRKDGSTFPARVHVTSVRSHGGAVRYRIVTVRDNAHEQQLQAELGQAQRLEAIGQLCAGVAHDFNNLLQAIISHLELAEDDVLPVATGEKSALRSTLLNRVEN